MLLGDLMYALPGIQQVRKTYDRKAIIYLGLNQKWPMAEGIMRRSGITLTQQDFDMIKPLLMTQEYISDVRVYNGEPTINLDDIMKAPINVPYGYIPRWYFYIFPDMACDLSKPWLHLDERIKLLDKGVILINRSARYHNPNIDYKFLEKYANRIIFIGLDDEWKSFCRVFFEVRHYKVQNFLELGIMINSCKFFIGNQSFPYSIAEGLKVPRLLELFSPLPNVVPHGENAYDFYLQGAFEFHIEQMMKQ
jgi:hypothetical protein